MVKESKCLAFHRYNVTLRWKRDKGKKRKRGKKMKEEKVRAGDDDGFCWGMIPCSERAVDLQTGGSTYMPGWHHDDEQTGAK